MDRQAELLFGIVSLQMGFVTKDQLVECAAVWMARASGERQAVSGEREARGAKAVGTGSPRPFMTLDEIILEKGYMKPVERDAVSAMVKVHLARNGNDPAKSIAKARMDRDLKGQLLKVICGAQGFSEDTIRLDEPDEYASRVTNARGSVVLTRPPEKKYSIKKEIGRGGLGRVMKAIDNDIGRPVALKFISGDVSSDYIERFHRESVVTGRLEHPHIVPVHDIGAMEREAGSGERRVGATGAVARGESAKQLYMTMKLIKGRDLGKLIKSIADGNPEDTATWSVRRLVEVFHDVCMAMAYAHSKGVIHRDLKPSNVMVGEFDETLVVDWGLANVRGQADVNEDSFRRARGAPGADRPSGTDIRPALSPSDTPQLTMEGEVMGTPQFMSPEQARGEISEIDERSDIFSLGAILYQILTLTHPFAGTTVLEIVLHVAMADFIPPSKCAPPHGAAGAVGSQDGADTPGRPWEIPVELEQICLKCMSLRKSDRYRVVTELVSEIDLYLEGSKERERRHGLAEECARQGARGFLCEFDGRRTREVWGKTVGTWRRRTIAGRFRQAPDNRPDLSQSCTEVHDNRPRVPYNHPEGPYNSPGAPYNRPEGPYNSTGAPYNCPGGPYSRTGVPYDRPIGPYNCAEGSASRKCFCHNSKMLRFRIARLPGFLPVFLTISGEKHERYRSCRRSRKQALAAHEGHEQAPPSGSQQADGLLPDPDSR